MKLKKLIVEKKQQIKKIDKAKSSIKSSSKNKHSSIDLIQSDESISNSNKNDAIIWSMLEGNIKLEDVEIYLRKYTNKEDTNFRKVLCAYDFKKYGGLGNTQGAIE